MNKLALEQVLAGPEVRDRDKIISGLKRSALWGLGVGAGAGLATLAGSHLLPKVPRSLLHKGMPFALGASTAGLTFLHKARQEERNRQEQALLNKKILVQMTEPDEMDRVRQIIQEQAPAGNKFDVFLSGGGHPEDPAGQFHREIVLGPGLSAEKIRRTIWRD